MHIFAQGKKKKKPAKQDKKHEKHHPEERLVLPVQCTSSLATKFPPVKPLGGGVSELEAPGSSGTPTRTCAPQPHRKPRQCPLPCTAVTPNGAEDSDLPGTKRWSLLPLKRFRFSWHTGQLPSTSAKSFSFSSSPFNAAEKQH